MKLGTTKRWLSTGFVAFYWLALPLLGLSLVALLLVWMKAGDQFSVRGLPDWLVVAVVILLPIAVIWRLLVHRRARKTRDANTTVGPKA